jgi:hypothetical protein
MTRPADIEIDEALGDAALLGAALGEAGTWSTWIAILRAAFGLPLSLEQRQVFASVAGDRIPPGRRVREFWAVAGRRSGKSRMAAAIVVYLALWAQRDRLSAGETGYVLCLSASRAQASLVHQYAVAFIEQSPVLRQEIVNITSDEIVLRGGIVIVAYWRDETSASPDVEAYRALLPSLTTTSGMLVGISSPHAQKGLLYDKFKSTFGRDNADVLTIQAPTVTFNPTIDAGIIDQAMGDDPEAGRAEWLGEFRGDLSTFVDRVVVEQCVAAGVREREFQLRYKYVAFADPSGGSHDSFGLAVAHREGERQVLDLVQEWRAPFSPSDVIEDVVGILKRYRLSAVQGDAYAGQWVVDAFRLHGISYRHAEQNRSELFLALLPLLMAGNAVLLDHPRLVGQISQLERRTGRSGKDAVDHMRGAHDDIAVAAAGALVAASALRGTHEAFAQRNLSNLPTRANVGFADIKKHQRGAGARP